jgi:hypothetical protein
MNYYPDLKRIAAALERLANAVDKSGVLQMRDVDRAKVYSQHLGKKLRPKKDSSKED